MQIPKYFYFRIKTDRKGLTVEVEDASDVDVAEVVRCRECKHYEPFRERDGFCKIDGMLNSDAHYCAYGERKGGDE